MSKRTALEFYRRRQTLASLETERPQSLKAVYDIINQSIGQLEDKLDVLILSYYGADENLEHQLKRWLPLVLTTLRQGRTMELVCREQMEQFYNRHDTLLEKSPFDEDTLDSVNDILNNITQTVHEGFEPITTSIKELTRFMSKYLKSFSSMDGDRYLETCTNYEKQRSDLERAISLNTQNIYLMVEKFEKDCLTIGHFDYVSKERAEKFGCKYVPILIVFPAAIDNIRNAFTGMRKWLEADSNYVDYIQNDYKELCVKREQQSRELKELQLQVSAQEYKFKCLRKDIDNLGAELERLKVKERVIDRDERNISEKNKTLSVDLDIKLYRLSEMKSGQLTDRRQKEQLERLQSEINLLKGQQPKLHRSLTDLQTKKSWMADKKIEKINKEKQLETVRAERRKVKKSARKCEVEVLRLSDCINKLKDIKSKKTSEEVLRKLFHNLPTVSKHTHNRKGLDKLDRAISIVSRYIDTDWTKLYWQLPFYPTRGEETKRQDIEDITHNSIRHSNEEQAKLCLCKWRRLHTRATLSCLSHTLLDIKRKDIHEKLQSDLKSRPKCSVSPKLYRTVHFPEIPVVDCLLF